MHISNFYIKKLVDHTAAEIEPSVFVFVKLAPAATPRGVFCFFFNRQLHGRQFLLRFHFPLPQWPDNGSSYRAL